MVPWLSRDGHLLLALRGVRAFGYGFLSVMLGIYLTILGFSLLEVGAVLTATLVGDALLTLAVTLWAERVGRRRSLVALSLGTAAAALLFLATPALALLLVAPLLGVISSAGKDAGAFTVLGQAMLPQTCPDEKRTAVFALDNLIGEAGLAMGALASGLPALGLGGGDLLTGYKLLIGLYVLLALGVAALYLLLSSAAEAPGQSGPRRSAGLSTSRGPVLRLASLFAVDAFGGGLIVQSFLAYWFFTRFDLSPGELGAVFFGASVLASLSFLVAAWLAGRIGLVNTMVFTHLPSNLILMAIPLAPTAPLAIALLFLRQSLSQMDVPTRQSYTVAIVTPEERVAAAGVTNLTRFGARALGPGLAGALFQSGFAWAPLLVGGAIKLCYDIGLFFLFRHVRPPEEARRTASQR